MSKDSDSPGPRRFHLHPTFIVLTMLLIAAGLTHVIPAGRFDRNGKPIVAGSYRPIPKANRLPAIVSVSALAEADSPARAAGVVAVLKAIPAGMTQASTLIFMIMFVGGTFGILRTTGVIGAGVDRLLQLTAGNVDLLGAGFSSSLPVEARLLASARNMWPSFRPFSNWRDDGASQSVALSSEAPANARLLPSISASRRNPNEQNA